MSVNTPELSIHLENVRLDIDFLRSVIQRTPVFDRLQLTEANIRYTQPDNSAPSTEADPEKSSQDIETVISNLNTTITSANSTIENVKDGKGVINYLSNDATLVKKIDHTVSNLDSAMIKINTAGIKLNDNLEALKHNWLLRGYFKNLEEEKEKIKKK